MKKWVTILFISFFITQVCRGQVSRQLSISGNTVGKKKQDNKTDIQLADLFKQSVFYLDNYNNKLIDYNKAELFARKAKDLSASAGDHESFEKAQAIIGRICLKRGDLHCATQILGELSPSAKFDLLIAFGDFYEGRSNSKDLDTAQLYDRQALKIGEDLKNPVKIGAAIHNLADVDYDNDNLNSALEKYEQVVKLTKTSNYRMLPNAYGQLSIIQYTKGNFNLALFYVLEGIKCLGQGRDSTDAGVLFFRLGLVYRNTGQMQKAVDAYETAYGIYKRNGIKLLWRARASESDALLRLKKKQEALELLKRTLKESPPGDTNDKILMDAAFGTAYKLLNNFDLAEKYFLDMVAQCRKSNPQLLGEAYRDLGQLYIETGRFKKGKPFVDSAAFLLKDIAGAYAHIQYMLFMADTALGNYPSAIDHLLKNKKLDDSINQKQKVAQIQELQIKYETEKKDQELKLKDQDITLQKQNILLLSRQGELQKKNLEKAKLEYEYQAKAKEQAVRFAKLEATKKDKDLLLKQQNIKILRKEGQVQRLQLQQANIIRNIAFAGSGLFLVIIFLLYVQYRNKQRSNRAISNQNETLSRLINEKEWLLKEVHHRVKNNLQTIVSLLGSQAVHLKSEALAAIKDSQNRVYAMSLLHQRLYGENNISAIEMGTYIRELVSYLRESIIADDTIVLNLQVAPVYLDIAQAIPVGLIVNESFTNAIKHAFSAGIGNKMISISMEETVEGYVKIVIADNGSGLPPNYKIGQSKGLGLTFIKGLSADLEADFKIDGRNGTKIMIGFIPMIISSEKSSLNSANAL